MKLIDTVKMMNSADYKERFRGEYFQLKIRIEGLGNMLEKYKNGTLTFTPSCSYELLHSQLVVMIKYLEILEDRANIEDINLD